MFVAGMIVGDNGGCFREKGTESGTDGGLPPSLCGDKGDSGWEMLQRRVQGGGVSVGGEKRRDSCLLQQKKLRYGLNWPCSRHLSLTRTRGVTLIQNWKSCRGGPSWPLHHRPFLV